MPHVEKHAPGSFNWIELATTDQNAAKHFYHALLGWQAQDAPMGLDGDYTTFMLDGQAAGGCSTIEKGRPMPPHWALSVAVEDADETAARAAALAKREMIRDDRSGSVDGCHRPTLPNSTKERLPPMPSFKECSDASTRIPRERVGLRWQPEACSFQLLPSLDPEPDAGDRAEYFRAKQPS